MLNNFEERVPLAECTKFLSLLIHAYSSLQLALNLVSLSLIFINYILKDMESLVKKTKKNCLKLMLKYAEVIKLTDTNKL